MLRIRKIVTKNTKNQIDTTGLQSPYSNKE